MSKNYDNWERLVRATLLREELRRLCREDSLSSSSSSSFSSSFSSDYSRSFHEPDFSSPSIHGIPSFSHRQIIRATKNFSKQNLITRGHSGDLFLGELSEPIVIKKIGFYNRLAFSSEIAFFSSLDSHSHPRFVPLLGHCSEDEREKFLVYRYFPRRDLTNSFYLKTDGDDVDELRTLDWITRSKIARGVAEGLAYLHHECNPPLVHGDVRASSILVDDKFEVRLGSLSHISAERVLKDKSRLTWRTTKKATSGKATKETCAYDVYCFGKVLLELLTGNLRISSAEDTNLKEILEITLLNISTFNKELVANIVDPSLIIGPDHLDEAWAVAIVAKACLNPVPIKRPIMRHVLKALEDPFSVEMDEKSERLETNPS
ncbi:Probable LRR receptor-like serine/threonine-protein kinase [Striga hermonthica]|uniref:Probable LRR receptor-like serine/threonine-protein kinase n=1 Tax=Striga hermonthica TaxID=68872 RepID=A0A9N7R2A5_STRHE|nr:Probable LRR receptor-like serine/threonine-protein kinase [Striga hermonthica]